MNLSKQMLCIILSFFLISPLYAKPHHGNGYQHGNQPANNNPVNPINNNNQNLNDQNVQQIDNIIDQHLEENNNNINDVQEQIIGNVVQEQQQPIIQEQQQLAQNQNQQQGQIEQLQNHIEEIEQLQNHIEETEQNRFWSFVFSISSFVVSIVSIYLYVTGQAKRKELSKAVKDIKDIFKNNKRDRDNHDGMGGNQAQRQT